MLQKYGGLCEILIFGITEKEQKKFQIQFYCYAKTDDKQN